MENREVKGPVPLIVVHDAKHPWVSALLGGCILAGLSGLIRGPDPSTPIDFYISGVARTLYYSTLIIAALIAIVGIWLPSIKDSLLIERIGLWFLCGPLIIYPIALFAFLGAPVGVGGSISCLLGVGGLARIVEIYQELKRWDKAVGK